MLAIESRWVLGASDVGLDEVGLMCIGDCPGVDRRRKSQRRLVENSILLTAAEAWNCDHLRMSIEMPTENEYLVGDRHTLASIGVEGYIVRVSPERWELYLGISEQCFTWVVRGPAGTWEVWSQTAIPPMITSRFETAILAAAKRIPERHHLRRRNSL
jgi:hypothetical protein